MPLAGAAQERGGLAIPAKRHAASRRAHPHAYGIALLRHRRIHGDQVLDIGRDGVLDGLDRFRRELTGFLRQVAGVGEDNLTGTGPLHVDKPLLQHGALRADGHHVAEVAVGNGQPEAREPAGHGEVGVADGRIHVQQGQVILDDFGERHARVLGQGGVPRHQAERLQPIVVAVSIQDVHRVGHVHAASWTGPIAAPSFETPAPESHAA